MVDIDPETVLSFQSEVGGQELIFVHKLHPVRKEVVNHLFSLIPPGDRIAVGPQ
jgi:hypothetical protein